MEVLCIGTAVMDITGYPIDQKKEWQEKQRIADISILPGGDALNQSIVLAAFGIQSAAAVCIGTDMNGMVLKDILKERGVDIRWIKEKPEYATGTAIILLNESGDRRIFSVRGAQSTMTKHDVPWELPKECRAVSLASLFSMSGFEKDGMHEYLQMAKREGKLVFADLAADKYKQGLSGIAAFLPYIDYFMPSLYDVMEMAGADNVRDTAHFFKNHGVKNVIIKCGEKGCYCLSDEFEGQVPAAAVEPVNTTGAGDCMVAVFISRILKGDGIREACAYACMAASCSTLFNGACPEAVTEENVEQFIKGEMRM